jgi:hypothetical protein
MKKEFTYSEKLEEDSAEYLGKANKIPLSERIYVDESGIERCLVREYDRAVRGVRIEDTKRGRKFRRTKVIAAQYSPGNGKIRIIAPFFHTQSATGEFFESWLRTKLIGYIPKGMTIIMDNASFRRKKKRLDLVRKHAVKLLFLSPYSPYL